MSIRRFKNRNGRTKTVSFSPSPYVRDILCKVAGSRGKKVKMMATDLGGEVEWLSLMNAKKGNDTLDYLYSYKGKSKKY